MARIPEAEIERIKREVSVERLVEASGVKLKRTGKDLFGRCPFHADDTASLAVTPSKNLWHCLGACQAGGDVFAWVMRVKGVSFRHAYELLKTDPSLAATPGTPVKQTTVRTLPAPVAIDADDQALLAQVVGYYHETLKASPEALAYLKSRGIDHPEAIERFRLGFANRTLGLRLPQKNRKEGEAVRSRLQHLGILRDSGHEHFNGSLIIPVMDEAGLVTEIYGRKITEGLRLGTPKHLYLPREGLGIGRGVWNAEALKSSQELVVCEALIDALSFWCAGYRNVTAAYGVEGFTDDHLAAFKRCATSRVLIAYDRDDAGEKAAQKLAERLMAEGIEAWRIQFPKGMDANEYALKVTPAAKSLGMVIRKALWLGKGAPPVRAEPAVVEPVAERVTTIAEPRAVEITAHDVQSPVRAVSSLAAKAAKEETIDEHTPEVHDHQRVDVVDCEIALPAPPTAGREPVTERDRSPVALPASPLPEALGAEIPMEVRAAEIVFAFGAGEDVRRYRVRGLQKNLAYDVLKVNVAAERGEALHVDTLDLRASKPKAAYITQAARELGVGEEIIAADLRKLLRALEALQESHIQDTLAPKAKEAIEIPEPERAAALALLRAPDLIERIVADLTACGLVGERTNKLVGYLAATSRKLDQPLAVLVQSSSAAGKTSLMDAVLAMMPEEERIKYSAVTGQSLFYLGEADLKHKVLAIVEEEGASRAAYALKLLQSEGELVIASTGKDPQTGELKAQEYKVEGPVMLFTTTTAADIDPELQNRCLVLSIDEGREQTRAIHALQRNKRTLEGLIARARKTELLAVHRNAQRLLKPLAVMNPYAGALTFPDTATRLRRDHEKYLTLIDTIALLHQCQRPIRTTVEGGKPIEYIEATLNDIALANQLAHEVLGRSLDELPPQTRRVLIAIDGFVAERAQAQGTERSLVRFSRRELREATGIGDTQLRLHLDRLVALEYMLARRDGAGGRFAYELVYDGQGTNGRPFVPGLIDVAKLRPVATTREVAGVPSELAGSSAEVAGRLRADRGPMAGRSRDASSPAKAHDAELCAESIARSPGTHCLHGADDCVVSYPHAADRDDALPLAAASRS